MIRTFALLVAMLIMATDLPVACAASPSDVGIVLMHGWGLIRNRPPGYINPSLWNDPLAEELKREGFHVIQQEMPWGPNRIPI